MGRRRDSQSDVDWRAYYTGGRRFANDRYLWADLPSQGVLGVVVFKYKPYRDIVTGGDWYWLDDGVPTCGDTTWDGWVEPPDEPHLKRGAADGGYETVYEQMIEDRSWPT